MHPARDFHWQDRDAMRALVADISFGALFVATPDGPRVAHVPVVIDGDTLLLHVARGNGITRHLDGATALFTVLGSDAYISPDWYGLGPDQVPTWNYVAVELEGRVHRLDDAGLHDQIDRLSASHEDRLLPKAPWTRAKADPAYIAKLSRGIIGFRLDITAWRGTMKLSQNKPDAARLAAAAALDAQGRRAMAHLMRGWSAEEDSRP